MTGCSTGLAWMAYQFHRVDLDEGMALVFRRLDDKLFQHDLVGKFRPRDIGPRMIYPAGKSFKAYFRGLDPAEEYTVRFERGAVMKKFSGQRMTEGIEIVVDNVPGAELIYYKRVP